MEVRRGTVIARSPREEKKSHFLSGHQGDLVDSISFFGGEGGGDADFGVGVWGCDLTVRRAKGIEGLFLLRGCML